MKKIIFTLCLIILIKFVIGQDVIIKKTGDEIKGKVSEVTSTEIKYKKTENPDVTYSIIKSEVFMIKYENGTKDVFNDNSVTNTTTYTNTSTPKNKVTTNTTSKQAEEQTGIIDVAESTIKVGGFGEEVFYYGFAEGDQIVFNFEEINGKELKEVEIMELPSSSKYMEYKTKNITDKTINTTKTGIYKFRLSNSAMGGRICKLKIQRIPLNETTKNFNTSVYWKTNRDTTFYMADEEYLISIDTNVVPVINNQIQTVHSQSDLKGNPNRTYVPVPLPENTVSWSYYLGVGESAEAIFNQAEEKAAKTKAQLNAASNITSKLALIDPSGSAAMATLALKGISYFGVPDKADIIKYWFVNDYQNVQLFLAKQEFTMISKGEGPLISSRMTSPAKGKFYICLKNENWADRIDVHIRISAVTVKENWGTRQIQKYNVKTWQEPYLINNINTNKPVNEKTTTTTTINNSNTISNDTKESDVVDTKTSTTNEINNTVSNSDNNSNTNTINVSSENKYFIIAGSYNTNSSLIF